MITPIEEDTERGSKESYEISVNHKPVFVAERSATGLEIKEAAIKAGLPIDLDFQLARVDRDGNQPIVGDADKVDVTEFKTFFATAGDDNS
ncbi:MAG: multiubiquitin domain-containing protein [Chloroflexi bacterium]|nr:multiubiquitin domain-containing protein [Chloroflexota bacterium]